MRFSAPLLCLFACSLLSSLLRSSLTLRSPRPRMRKQTTIGPAESSIAARTRRQTRIRARDDEREEKHQPAHSSAHVSPAMRIYWHALESIFAMLNLHDLTQILAVSRSWAAAVRSMRPIGATVKRHQNWEAEGEVWLPLPPVASLVTGPLLRHLAAMQILETGVERSLYTLFSNESLALLAQHTPQLTSLWCRLALTPDAALILPPKLIALKVELTAAPPAVEVNRLLTVLAALPCVQRLCLEVTHDVIGVHFSLLAASRSLTDLCLEDPDADLKFDDDQVAEIRSSLGHLQSFSISPQWPDNLARFLQPPVTMRWQDVGFAFANATTGDHLIRLPTLTKLDLWFDPTPHVDFLSQLPLLTSLKLDCKHCEGGQVRSWTIPAAPLLASLLPCAELTELVLVCGLSSAQLSALFAKLTKLKTFSLWGALETLQCFASGPAMQTLEELYLGQISPLPQSELVHLFGLRQLRSLTLDRIFESVDDATLDSLCPPSALLPRLTHLDWDRVRTGPSFEWMQQRLTQ